MPDIPWIYTGGLENHPAVVQNVSRSHPLWGNGAEAIAKIRNPWLIADVLTTAGLPALRVWPRAEPPPHADGTWMQKPLRGAAGRGIGIWERRTSCGQELREETYFQERRGGVPISALFLAFPGRAFPSQTQLLGITRQLVGLADVHAPPFAWCGTITPTHVSSELRTAVLQIGAALAAWADLRGLFGCDFLVDDGTPWLTEVNPRYPASTELIEHQLAMPLLEWHRRACDPLVVPPSGGVSMPTNEALPVVGKIILYARSDVTAPDLSRFIFSPNGWITGTAAAADPFPYIADIPVPGTRIAAGQPICTLFARARDENECLAKLKRRAARLESRLR